MKLIVHVDLCTWSAQTAEDSHTKKQDKSFSSLQTHTAGQTSWPRPHGGGPAPTAVAPPHRVQIEAALRLDARVPAHVHGGAAAGENLRRV